MTKFIDVFNGDADGLCALLQWRLVYPATAMRISGVKRNNALVRHVQAGAGDRVLVLDINFENNRTEVQRLLDAGAQVDYFDHHYPGERLTHPNLRLTVNEAPTVCTSLLVNQALAGQQVAWAIVGAFGDNLPREASELARVSGFPDETTARLCTLGELLNYNGYGSQLADLHFDPVALYTTLHAHATPLAFVADAPEYRQLREGHAGDMALAHDMRPREFSATAAVYELPDAPWARRVIGVWANLLSQAAPGRAHLILCPDGAGSYTASLRAAQQHPLGAAEFCRRFPGGGGRAAAAGINGLSRLAMNDVIARFMESF